ncbi:MAG: RNB domain-containing ribonuclease [Bacilli bacterium]|nr:RNB domain-containing ribonuclease [Bacilli bacterium]
MKNIEKALQKFAEGKGPRVGYKILCENKSKTSNELINILAKLVSEDLDKFTGENSLDKSIDLLKSMTVIIENCDDINRKIVTRKLHKLYEKIERITEQKKKTLVNLEEASIELDTLKQNIESVQDSIQNMEPKKYDFLRYLITGTQNTDYLEYSFTRMPELVNAKDKYGDHILVKVTQKYLGFILANDEKQIFHYSNIISLILRQNTLELSPKEQRKITDEIYTTIDKLSVSKKIAKQNKDKINWLNNLIKTIKNMDIEEKDIEEIAAKYKIPVNFDEILKETAKLTKVPQIGEDNRYFVDDYVITIDKRKADEIDDALSCKKLPNGNYLLGVHIASVLSYYPYDSLMIDTAISRTQTIYLPRMYCNEDKEQCKIIPIFPFEFSTNRASLLPNQPRYTRSYYYEIDNEGNVVNEKYIKSIIKSNKKTTYEEVNKVLEHGTSDTEFEETVLNLQAVTELLDKKYKPSEFYEKIKESNDDYSDLRVKRVGSEKIVYQAMLLTGNRVANYFANSKEGYPCLYRVHETNENNNKKLEAMIENLTVTYGGDQYRKLYQLLEGIYPKGWYGIEGKHNGLGLDHYCHCTSALRRGPDIVVEHALEVCYDNTPTDKEIAKLEAEIKRRVTEINSKLDPIEWFAKECKKSYQKKRK